MSDDLPPAEQVSRALLIAGATLATVSVAVWMLNAIPAMPEWMIRLAIYKLTLASGAGLMVAGAVLRRTLHGERPAPGAGAAQLGEGAPPPIRAAERPNDRVNSRRPQ